MAVALLNPNGIPDGYAAEALKLNPAWYARMNEPAAPVMRDSSGMARDGSYVGGSDASVMRASLLTSGVGSSASFGGGDFSYGQVAYDGSWMAVQNFSMSAIIKPTSVVPTYQTVLARYAGATPAWTFRLDGNKLLLYVFTGGMFRSAVGVTSLVGGTTYHVTGTFNAATTTIKVYVNGVEDGTLTDVQINPNLDSSPLRVGANGSGGETFAGLIDEALFYPYTLTAPQIATLAAAR